MRLIDATRLVKLALLERDKIPLSVKKRNGFGTESPNHHGQSMRGGIRKIIRLVEQMPTIDAVPVVRCKDCKHRGGYHCPMFYEELWSYDEDSSKWIEHDKTVDNGFCHRGGKKGMTIIVLCCMISALGMACVMTGQYMCATGLLISMLLLVWCEMFGG